MQRILDFLPSDQLLQVGIRSGTKEEYQEMLSEERYIEPNPSALAEALENRGFQKAPIYVTFDIDAFDPAEVPGTGTPEAGGISWQAADSMRAVLEGTNIVGFDLVELAPGLDPSGISSVLAAKLLREWLLTIAIPS
jgi:agmatinase